MAYGFLVRTENDVLQVDENYRNLVFKSKYQVTLTKDINNPGVYNIQYIIPKSNHPNCLIAVRASKLADRSRPITVREHNNSWYVSIHTAGSSLSIPVDVYVFSYADNDFNTPAGNYGVVVRDANGKITFDSNQKYLRIRTAMINQLGINIYGDSSGYVAFNGSTTLGDNWAYFAASSANVDELQVTDDDEGWYSKRLINECYTVKSGSSVNITVRTSREIENSSSNPSGMPSAYGTVNTLLCSFLIDVTGY